MASPPPPPCYCCCCACPCPCADQVIILRVPTRPSVFAPDRPPWMSQLAEADFSKSCVADRVCNTCGGAAFCEHCCGGHHRGHDTSPAAIANGNNAAAAHRRDSFCTGCRVAFCSELCSHHDAAGGGCEGHEVIPVVEHDRWHCARCTGAERWFPAIFNGVQALRDEHRNLLVPLHWKGARVPECPSWFPQILTADFSKTCATDRVCNTCGGAGFCEHCCGEHHRVHDTAAAIAKDKEPSAVHRRDSFCIRCRVAFCSDLCAHHHAAGEGHEVIPIEEHDRWYCARCTGTEPWYLAVLGAGPPFKDKHGNPLVPLVRKSTAVPDYLEPGRKHSLQVQDGEECPPWMFRLLTADFSKTCAPDSLCNTCGGAAFCEHCCVDHHQGHDATTAKEKDGSMALSKGYRRNSFCIDCRIAFCLELCAHHAGHEVIPVDEYGDRHFVRSTGSEPWFTTSAFGGIETFEDKDGNLMVPLERKRSRPSSLPEPGLRYHHGESTTPPAAANQFEEMDGGEAR